MGFPARPNAYFVLDFSLSCMSLDAVPKFCLPYTLFLFSNIIQGYLYL